jgi:hypothetical protein
MKRDSQLSDEMGREGGGAEKGNPSQTLVLSSVPWVCSQTGIIHPDMKQYAI